MLNCRSMRAAVTLSAVLLTLGVVLGIIATMTTLTLPWSQLSLLLVLGGAGVLGLAFVDALLPGAARRMDECRH